MTPQEETQRKPLPTQAGLTNGRIGGGVLLLILGGGGVWLGAHARGQERALEFLLGFAVAFASAAWLGIEMLLIFAVKTVKSRGIPRT